MFNKDISDSRVQEFSSNSSIFQSNDDSSKRDCRFLSRNPQNQQPTTKQPNFDTTKVKSYPHRVYFDPSLVESYPALLEFYPSLQRSYPYAKRSRHPHIVMPPLPLHPHSSTPTEWLNFAFFEIFSFPMYPRDPEDFKSIHNWTLNHTSEYHSNRAEERISKKYQIEHFCSINLPLQE